jgi:UPF0755 protein
VIRVEIESGDSIFKIADKLCTAGVISSPLCFVVLAFIRGCHTKVQAGEYSFPVSTSLWSVLTLLASGAVVLHRIVIPEGVTIRSVLEITNAHPCLCGPSVGALPEGTILPGTYFFSGKTRRERIIGRMQNGLNGLLSRLDVAKAPLGLSIGEIITLASIVEKETDRSTERSLIASVFLNRLRINMRLQADPTVIYAIESKFGKLNRPLCKQDLKFDSPYNTYRHAGLPPTPICCPGKEAIKSIFYAKPSKFLYFVATPKGGHEFSETLQEHNRSVVIGRRKKH